MVLRVFIDDHFNSEALPIYKKDCQQQRKEQHGNADLINIGMR